MSHTIYLARHGQDQDNAASILNGQRDTPLTDVGLGQARLLAQTIVEAELGIQKVFSSPLQRAYVTAEMTADALGLPKPEKLDLLIERNFGIMTGLPTNCIAERCAPDIIQGELITYFLAPEGAETFPDLIMRAHTLLEWIEKNVAEERILLVGHGDMGKMIKSCSLNIFSAARYIS